MGFYSLHQSKTKYGVRYGQLEQDVKAFKNANNRNFLETNIVKL